MSKHTPGPWSVWTSCSWRRIGNAETNELVCEPIVQRHDGQPDLHFRNGGWNGPDAHLIAAAPDLYEALRKLVVRIDSIDGSDATDLRDELDAADAALAKAKGEDVSVD